MSLTRQPLTDIQDIVVRLHDEAHLTFVQIGRQLEVTGARANQVYLDASARLRDFNANGSTAVSLLHGRARWVLEYCGLKSWAETRAAMEAGHLQASQGDYAVYWRKEMLPSVGRKTWSVLYKWAGKPVMTPFDRQSILK